MMRRRAVRGFTLIEMIAVVTIVALVMGLAAVRMDNLIPKYKVRAVAREVGALLRQAKAKAAGSGRDVYVEIDVSKGEYWLLAAFPVLEDDGKPKEPPQFKYDRVFRQALPDDVRFVDVIAGKGRKVTEGQARVRAGPLGLAGHVIVNLQGTSGHPMSVKLNGLTGNLAFSEGYTDADDTLEDSGE